MMYARRRDANEAGIMSALRRAGAQVEKLEGPGVPDLIVCYRGVLTLVEVKDVKEGKNLATKRNAGPVEYRELTPAQVAWWKRWLHGKPVAIVHDVAEAYAAVGIQAVEP